MNKSSPFSIKIMNSNLHILPNKTEKSDLFLLHLLSIGSSQNEQYAPILP